MRRLLVLALAVAITSLAHAGPIDPAEAWKPMHPFIGTWKGTRSGSDGSGKVTLEIASAPTNHHLEITENGGGRSKPGVWGIVSFDAQKEVLILRQFGADGSASDMALDASASTTERIVFASLETEATRTRVTYERSGANVFVERVERSAGGEPFAVVSETQFVRKG